LHFSVEDDGTGFDPDAVRRGTGLQNMTDRLQALGGDLQIVSAPDQGTRLAGEVPIDSADRRDQPNPLLGSPVLDADRIG
jgi:glucose-6-phosphate-specific signal transduction histidine kinase